MKRIVFGCCLLIVLAVSSCKGGKKKIDPFETLTEQIDSMTAHPDSVQDTIPVVEDVIPATADESFADFFYNFASDEDFQRSRIVFPLTSYKGKEAVRIPKEDWNYDPLFSRQPAYTVLFESEEEMEMEKIPACTAYRWI